MHDAGSAIDLRDIVTNLITAFLVIVAVLAHATGVDNDLTFVDMAALLALGRTYGTISAANGYAKATQAAHRRLDSIGAPPAEVIP
jgi:hypothetical protein